MSISKRKAPDWVPLSLLLSVSTRLVQPCRLGLGLYFLVHAAHALRMGFVPSLAA